MDPMHPLGLAARHLARAAEGDIGVGDRMHRLSPRGVVVSAEAIWVLVVVIVTAIVNGNETAMEGG